MDSNLSPNRECRSRIRVAFDVRGVVQGVGMRPAMARLAARCRVCGFVRNDGAGVRVEVEGDPADVARFADGIRTEAPPQARVEAIESHPLAVVGELQFRIDASDSARTGAIARIPPDIAPCSGCLEELADRRARRYRHPFISCTDCGPRLSIVDSVPYDRNRTSMASFSMCVECWAEYEDAGDRRFHSQTNACPRCGPVTAFLLDGARVADEPIATAARAIAEGRIIAVKGVGGFVLATNAADERAVARLRERKRRPHKPFAVMAGSLDDVERIALVDSAARAALVSWRRPIVLLPRRPGAAIASTVAPDLAEIGVFLPPSPLQQLLLDAGPPLQVMTSGNASGEPLAKDEDEASSRLAGIADGFLFHDRAIVRRADDSIVRVVRGAQQLVRRARGFVPEAIALPVRGPAVLAFGADLKSTLCLAHDGEATLSPHVGDLANPDALAYFDTCRRDLVRLVGAEPVFAAHDLHPDYHSTRRALACGLRCVPVQHHHAHVAACLAEHGERGPAIGVAFDGTGCGPEGELWGGEILVFDLVRFERAGHLWPLRLPGGEAAIREPWRLAIAALVEAGEPLDVLVGLEPEHVERIRALVEREIRAPSATGAGRWFDAIAAIAGIRHAISYEGQAAIELDAEAARIGEADPYPFAVASRERGPFVLDLRPTTRAVAADVRAGIDRAVVGARFYETMARAAARGCELARAGGAPRRVALSGGCFQSRRLTERVAALLESSGFDVLIHRKVPPNDGGIAYGQAAIATCRVSSERRGAA